MWRKIVNGFDKITMLYGSKNLKEYMKGFEMESLWEFLNEVMKSDINLNFINESYVKMKLKSLLIKKIKIVKIKIKIYKRDLYPLISFCK